ncbi:MAG: YigZ family protein [Eubacterium sp.]|nr:YigZ family protein [Eubacterium sp.]
MKNILFKGGSGEIVEKKSRFIATVLNVTSEEEAQSEIARLKKQYWDARHNCYAYVIGDTGEFTRCSDDGEPSGTAGRPILDILRRAEVQNCLVVVTRYFGGTLLGTGGLVRAYSQATQAGLAASVICEKQRGIFLDISCDYSALGKMQYISAQMQVPVLDTIYEDSVIIKLMVPLALKDSLTKKIADETGGSAGLSFGDEADFILLDNKVEIL